MDITKAIYQKLVEDEEMVQMLGQYGDQPAVFSTYPVPEGTGEPYAMISGPVTDVPFDTKTSIGREVTVDIRFYDAQTGSSQWIDAVAQRARDVLHRAPLIVEGYRWVLSAAMGPIAADDENAQGRLLSIRAIISRSE